MQAMHPAGVGHGQAEQQQQPGQGAGQQQAVMFQDNIDRMDSGPMSGLWSAGPAVMQPHQLHPHQQLQLQQQLMLGGPAGLNMMIGQPGQHVSMGHMFPVQSPPSASSGQFLHLPGAGHQQQQPRQIGDTVITPNSTPGLQTPTPSATPPILNHMGDNRDNLFHNRIVPGQDFEAMGGDSMDPMMGWRGLQALQGGTIADMFGAGVERQFGLFGGGMQGPGDRPGEQRHPGAPGFPPAGAHLPVSGFNNFSVAMAQAQENMMRLQQFQQQNPEFINKQQQLQQQFAGGPNPHIDMTRHFPGLPPPQCQSPSPNGFSLPPGPRPRPVGGDSSPPGFSADTPLHNNLTDEFGGNHLQQQQAGPGKNVEQQLVIGSWNDECEKEAAAAAAVSSLPPLTAPPPSVPHNMSQPPPRFVGADQEWGGTFQVPRSGGHSWAPVEEFQPVNEFKKHEKEDTYDGGFKHDQGGDWRGRGRGGRGRGGPRGGSRGGFNQVRPGMDHSREKVQGKNAAIEETKAMLAKMRLEDKELMNKNRKGGEGEGEQKPGVQLGAYRPRDNRRGGFQERGRGGRGGRGRGGPPQFPPQQHPMMRMPFIPGDFRTPPFPGMEGFLPPAGFQFPPNIPPGLFPLGFNRGRGFPIGFPRGFRPPMLPYRGRGNRGYPGGRGGAPRNKEFVKRDPSNPEDTENNPMMSAIYGNNPENDEENNKEEPNEKEDETCEKDTAVAEKDQENAAVIANSEGQM